MTEPARHGPRFGLLPRILASLVAVGVLPLAAGVVPALQLNRRAMIDQVLRTQSLAARATAERLAARVGTCPQRTRTLASSRLLDDPSNPALADLLRSTLAVAPQVGAIVVLDGEGTEIIRAQRPALAEVADRVIGGDGDGEVEAFRVGETLWLRCQSPIATDLGRAVVIEDFSSAVELLHPEDLGDQATLLVLDRRGEVVLGDPVIREKLPEALVAQATRQRLGGAGRYEDTDGRRVLGAFDPVAGISWAVVSMQPQQVAEAVAERLQRTSAFALALALGLCGGLVAIAHRSVIKPLRGLLAAQRELAGEGTLAPGNELVALRESFELLARRVREREALGEVFLGRYQVIEVLAEGAMGTVFRGWDPKLQRAVALKTIRLGGELGAHRQTDLGSALVREAITAAQFSHPNIVAVYDAEDTPGAAYVAMELVEGIGLDRKLWEHGPLAPPELVPIGAAVARALEAAHERRLVHRDIKPANVLLGYDGSIKVADFGISSLISAATPTKQRIFGTPGYLAPEILGGGKFDQRSDLFALGVLLYEAAAGKHPFAEESMEDTLVATMSRPVPPLDTVASVPQPLSSLVTSLLAKEPERRPRNAAAVAGALEGMAASEGWRWSGSPGGDRAAAEPQPRRQSPRAQWMATRSGGTILADGATDLVAEHRSPRRRPGS